VAKELYTVAARYGSYIKGHYSDFVENPGGISESGIGSCNIGLNLRDEYDLVYLNWLR